MNILERIAAESSYKAFHAQTTGEVFALKLARRLGEPEVVRHYVQLAEMYSQERLLVAYRRTVAHADHGENQGRRFQKILERIQGSGFRSVANRLLSVKVERRSISAAVFARLQLDYTQTRHLPSSGERAEPSAIGFINHLLHHFDVESVTLERIGAAEEIRRVVLNRAIKSILREYGLPVWEVEKRDLLAAFAHPAPNSRREMREVVRAIWPVLDGNAGVLDAAALGLHVQTESLFIYET